MSVLAPPRVVEAICEFLSIDRKSVVQICIGRKDATPVITIELVYSEDMSRAVKNKLIPGYDEQPEA